MNSTNETLLFDRFLIMYNLCVFTCIIVMFVFHCTHVRKLYVLNSYLLTYLFILSFNIFQTALLYPDPPFSKVHKGNVFFSWHFRCYKYDITRPAT